MAGQPAAPKVTYQVVSLNSNWREEGNNLLYSPTENYQIPPQRTTKFFLIARDAALLNTTVLDRIKKIDYITD